VVSKLVGTEVVQSTARSADTSNDRPCDRAREASARVLPLERLAEEVTQWGSGSRSLQECGSAFITVTFAHTLVPGSLVSTSGQAEQVFQLALGH
jgi:hypothetical protein